jgi:hypothetical protein
MKEADVLPSAFLASTVGVVVEPVADTLPEVENGPVNVPVTQ